MDQKKQAVLAVEGLKKVYPDAICSLEYRKPYELLISVCLSAQCTDARVNQVTAVLFSKFPTLQSIAKASIEEIEEIIKPCGLFHTKAKNISALSKILVTEYGGALPDSLEELIKLPGVGRKTANLIMGDVFHQPAVVTDTHCIRICGRLGLTDGSKDPYKVELQLRQVLPMEEASDFCHRLVLFGRENCRARSPRCGDCPIVDFCPKNNL